MIADNVIAVLIIGTINILQNFRTLHCVIFIIIKLNPSVGTKILNNTAIEVPTTPHLIVNGYIKATNMIKRTVCHIVSILGFPTAENMVVDVIAIDLIKPAQTST